MLREKNEEEEKEKQQQGDGEDEEEKETGIWPTSRWACPGEIYGAAGTLETRENWMLRVESQARLWQSSFF